MLFFQVIMPQPILIVTFKMFLDTLKSMSRKKGLRLKGRTKSHIISFLIVVFALLLIFNQSGDTDEEEPHMAWDCTFSDSELCELVELNERFRCDGPNGEMDQDHCRTTEDGYEEVTMFTDQANHITAPMTEEEYSIDILEIGEVDPWDAEFRDGNLYYTEMEGYMVIHDLEDEVDRIEVPGTEKFGNTGLLGLALDPEFEDNGYVYFYHFDEFRVEYMEEKEMSHDPVYNSISRFTLEDGEFHDQKILIDEIEGSSGHSGGRIKIKDDMLYATTGDGELVKSLPDEIEMIQDIDYLGGKVLRMNLDGSIPEDNPFEDSPVYAYGLRNPQGLDFHPETGDPFISVHGPWQHEEIVAVKNGANYGWPAYKCDKPYQDLEIEGEIAEGVYCFDAWTIAPSGTTFVDDEDHPWYGSYFVTGLRGSMLYRIEFDPETYDVELAEIFYIKNDEAVIDVNNRLRNVEFYDGSLYLFGDGHGAAILSP